MVRGTPWYTWTIPCVPAKVLAMQKYFLTAVLSNIINCVKVDFIYFMGAGVQNWFGLTEKFQVLKICPRKIPKFASGNFFNVAIRRLHRLEFYPRVFTDGAPELLQTALPFWNLPPSSFRWLRRLEFCPRTFTDGFAVWILPPTGSLFGASGAKKLQLYLLEPSAREFASGLKICPRRSSLHFSSVLHPWREVRSIRS